MDAVAVARQHTPKDFLRVDPDTGSVDVMIWDTRRFTYRAATADDLLDLYILENAPGEAFCEFDGRREMPSFS